MKAITTDIRTCKDCPHLDHMGAFAEISYKPICRNTNRPLDFNVAASPRGSIVASLTDVIPDWCPLDDKEEIIQEVYDDK
jgi:hypothetical protein